MTEAVVVGGSAPPCPDSSKHKRRPLWRTAIDLVAAALLFVFSALFVWAVVGIRVHMLTVVEGSFGTYAAVVIPEILAHDVEVVSFSATRIPSRIVSIGRIIRWPVPEVIEVTVVYRGPDKVAHTWGHTYLLACKDDGSCIALSQLRALNLSGCCHPDGTLNDRGSLYFRFARPPIDEGIDEVPTVVPSAVPPSAPPEGHQPVPPPPVQRQKPPQQKPGFPSGVTLV